METPAQSSAPSEADYFSSTNTKVHGTSSVGHGRYPPQQSTMETSARILNLESMPGTNGRIMNDCKNSEEDVTQKKSYLFSVLQAIRSASDDEKSNISTREDLNIPRYADNGNTLYANNSSMSEFGSSCKRLRAGGNDPPSFAGGQVVSQSTAESGSESGSVTSLPRTASNYIAQLSTDIACNRFRSASPSSLSSGSSVSSSPLPQVVPQHLGAAARAARLRRPKEKPCTKQRSAKNY